MLLTLFTNVERLKSKSTIKFAKVIWLVSAWYRIGLQVSSLIYMQSYNTFHLLIPRNGYDGNFRNQGELSEALSLIRVLFQWGSSLLNLLLNEVSSL